MSKIRVGVIGGTGYTGVELLRLLAGHPNAEVAFISSRSEAGRSVEEIFPNLRGHFNICFSPPSVEAFSKCDLVFSATPNGIAMTHARALMERGVRLIDLAADFRLKDQAVWEQWYGMEHVCPELLEEAVYGLPELNREFIADAQIVANPGCYPTATTLGFLPLIKSGLVTVDTLIADTKSGVTGAGRGASVANLYSEVADSFKAYAVGGHRHLPEIMANLNSVSNKQVGLTFVPHLTPMLRGIHATLYADLIDKSISIEELHSSYLTSYENEPFVDIMPLGSHPDTRSVKGSNMCRIAIHRAPSSSKIVVLSVIDNLTKGAAGQALQNMNIMFGLPEHTALQGVAILP